MPAIFFCKSGRSVKASAMAPALAVFESINTPLTSKIQVFIPERIKTAFLSSSMNDRQNPKGRNGRIIVPQLGLRRIRHPGTLDG